MLREYCSHKSGNTYERRFWGRLEAATMLMQWRPIL